MNGDLFAAFEHARHPTLEPITPGAVWLRAFADEHADQLMQALAAVLRQAPLRQMQTPGGYTMSVASSNCEQPWPALPALFVALATRAAAAAGFAGFVPDACLINRYVPGARMSLHQDKNERDMTQPIVSVSLGLPATFRFGGDQRSDKTVRLQLESGDVVVWGGPARWRFHGVDAVPEGMHQLTGHCRFNLTMRKAG
jgi:alkylated DNA repair protein (DNA oxidative demethylase)